MRLIASLLRLVYRLLYHQFAWSYDLVAAVVSLGRWQDWVRAVLPRLRGRVLELGYGPGHLQAAMHAAGLQPAGLDESRAMAHQASRRIRKMGLLPRLVRGYAQALPYPAGSFDTVVATFPSEYIFDLLTLGEVRRVLVTGGELLVLPVAWIEGRRWHERAAAWLLRAGGLSWQSGLPDWIAARFSATGLQVGTETEHIPGSCLLFIRALKTG
jgi:ubiquinone/menaquinone biosynthesis C-methylase UbiE